MSVASWNDTNMKDPFPCVESVEMSHYFPRQILTWEIFDEKFIPDPKWCKNFNKKEKCYHTLKNKRLFLPRKVRSQQGPRIHL